MFAISLFDNAAETPDELSFPRGEMLTVLEKDFGGVEGWWLCSTTEGRTGLAPANRLRSIQVAKKSSIIANNNNNIGGNALEDYDIPQSLDNDNKSRQSAVTLTRMTSESEYDIPTAARQPTAGHQTFRAAEGSNSPATSRYRVLPQPSKQLSVGSAAARRPAAGLIDRGRVAAAAAAVDEEDYDVPKPADQQDLSLLLGATNWSEFVESLRDVATAASQLTDTTNRWRAAAQNTDRQKSAAQMTSQMTYVVKSLSATLRKKLIKTASIMLDGRHLQLVSTNAVLSDFIQRLQVFADGLLDLSHAERPDFAEWLVNICRGVRRTVDEFLQVTQTSSGFTPVQQTMSLPLPGNGSAAETLRSSNPARMHSNDQDASDYDMPTARHESADVAGVVVRSHHGKPPDSYKRVAVVVDRLDDRCSGNIDAAGRLFDVIERRPESDTLMTRSKLVTESFVDYDYPAASSNISGAVNQSFDLPVHRVFHEQADKLLRCLQDSLQVLSRDHSVEKAAVRGEILKRTILTVYGFVLLCDASRSSASSSSSSSRPSACDELIGSVKTLVAAGCNSAALSQRSLKTLRYIADELLTKFMQLQ